MEFIPRHCPTQLPDIYVLVIIVAMLIGAIAIMLLWQGHGGLLSRLDAYISGQRNYSVEWDFGICYIALLGVAGHSLVAVLHFVSESGAVAFWKAAGIITGIFALRIFLCFCYKHVFFPNSRNSMTRSQLLYVALSGMSSMLAYFIAAYSPFVGDMLALTIFIILQLFFATVLAILDFVNFFSTPKLLFEYILYLCTLEILPLAVMYKLLENTFTIA